MARLPRLVVPGHAHYVIQRGHGGLPVFEDATDRQTYIAALHEGAAHERVLVHAWALLDAEVQLLVTPPDAPALSRMVQALGRRYVSAHHRRHRCSGAMWDGRYRCAVVEPGATRLAALRLIDGLSSEPGVTSAGSRSRGTLDGRLVDPPEYWALGNTPFDRESAWRGLLAQGLPTAQVEALRRAALGGWVAGSTEFAAEVGAGANRPARPRSPGRPRLVRA